MPSVAAYLTLLAAILAETFATAMLQRPAQFTTPLPMPAMGAGHALPHYLLPQGLRAMPLGAAYALWSGQGIILVTTIGVAAFGQKLDSAALIGLGLIVSGVAVVNLFSSGPTQ